MRVIQFKCVNKTTETKCDDPIIALKEEIKRRLSLCKSDDDLAQLSEELITFIKELLSFIEKDRRLTAIHGPEIENTEEEQKLLDEKLPEDRITYETIVNELVLDNEDIPDEIKLKLRLHLQFEKE